MWKHWNQKPNAFNLPTQVIKLFRIVKHKRTIQQQSHSFIWVMSIQNNRITGEMTPANCFLRSAAKVTFWDHNFTTYAHTYFSVTKSENSLCVFPHHSTAPGYCVGCLQIYAALQPPCGLFCDHLAAAESPSLPSVHLFHCWQLCTLYQIDLDLDTNRRKVMSFSLHQRPTADIINW
jgi:hypothetical protein